MPSSSPPRASAHAAQHDQYFTRPRVARLALAWVDEVLEGWGLDPASLVYIEPSAGNGAFVDPLLEAGRRVWAGDVDPQHPAVRRRDFLACPPPRLPRPVEHRVVVGNPPFGRKADLAVAFLNRSLSLAPCAGLVLPVQLRKWSAQCRVSPGALLLVDRDLPEDAFTFRGQDYRLRCCFQVWSTRAHPGLPDLRLSRPPPVNHPHFQAWQFNRTPEALKYFDMDWDFAVLRQGFGDFSRQWLPSERATMCRKKQWIFIKATSPQALARLRGLDFPALSRGNTGVPGFGKADLVAAYEQALSERARR